MRLPGPEGGRMKTLKILGLFVCMLFVFSSFGAAINANNGNNDNKAAEPLSGFVPGELLIKFKSDTPSDNEKNVRDSLKAKEVDSFKSIGVKHWKLEDGTDVEAAIKSLENKYKDEIEYVEPNGYRSVTDTAVIPSDAYRGELWAMHNFGQTGGAADADIDALESWQAYTDAGTIVVAVLDSGIDYNHEDLAANIWENPGEKGYDNLGRDKRTNGVDDDSNGFIDDWHGWDFVNNDNNPMDDNGHGTHVAGTIGAVGNNGIGVTGICWKVQLMPLKFLNSGGGGSTVNQVKAINYAASFGVPITSNSYGGDRKYNTEQDAIKSSGALFVCAAGNSGSTTKWYPAGYTMDNIISVAATGPSDELASWSNYGSDWVDLGAPGVNILSSVPNNGYALYNGTSMATPHVTGAAAIVLKNNPGYTSVQVKNKILSTVEAKSSLSGKTVTGGRLNVRAALGLSNSFTDTVDPGTIDSISEDSAKDTLGSVTLTWTAKGDDGDSNGPAYMYDLRYRADGPVTAANWGTSTRFIPTPGPNSPGTTESVPVTGLREGIKYYFGVKVVDELGHHSAMTTAEATTKQEPTAFTTEQVDNSKMDLFHSFAYDPNGVPSVAFCDRDTASVYFSKKTANGWSREKIASADSYVGLAYDLSGMPCIAYGTDTLIYARYDGTKWTSTTIATRVSFYGRSLAFDKDGNPGIAFYKGGMSYAHYSGGSWSTSVVDSTARVSFPAFCTLVYNPAQADRPAIAFSDSPNSGEYLRYADYDGSKWTMVNVAGELNAHYGWMSCLAFDYNNKPTISCQNNGTVYLLYKNANGVWTREIVQQTVKGDGMGPTSLCYSSAGVPYVCYRVPDPLNQRYKLRLAHQGPNGWESELVAPSSTNMISMKRFVGTGGEIIGVIYDPSSQLCYATRSL